VKFKKSKKILFIFFLFISIILISELAANLFEKKTNLPVKCFKKEFKNGFMHTPNSTCLFRTNFWNITYQINSQGLRDVEYQPNKRIDTFRIAIVGDSFVEGVGVEVEDTFAKKLEARLNQSKGDHNYEVLNAGTAAYSPLLEYLVLKNTVLKYNPDLVILVFEPINFLDENHYQNLTSYTENGEPTSVLPHLPSHIIDYILNLDTNPQKSRNKNLNFIHNFKLTSFARGLISSQSNNQSSFKSALTPNNQSQESVQKSLLRIKNLLLNNEIEFQIVTLPIKEQLENPQLHETFDSILKFGEKEKVPVLDLTTDLQKTNWQDLYIKGDLHLNEKGHEFIAEKLSLYLNLPN